MQCPICKLNLEPLDPVSRNEHVDLCLENGPSVVDVDEFGRPIVKKNIAYGKQRKICPICAKTFQNLRQHFKNCALNNDLPPDLMLDHWEKINAEESKPKPFPRDLLDNFVAKCIKEGRVGGQVDLAKALSLSMGGSEDHFNRLSVIEQQQPGESRGLPEDSVASTTTKAQSDANQILMRSSKLNIAKKANTKALAKTYRLQVVDDAMKKANIALRIERELAATRSRRYRETVQDHECSIINENLSKCDFGKLFNRARMKNCDGSENCQTADCFDHELLLLMDEFIIYSGPAMDAPPRPPGSEQVAFKNDVERDACDIDNKSGA